MCTLIISKKSSLTLLTHNTITLLLPISLLTAVRRPQPIALNLDFKIQFFFFPAALQRGEIEGEEKLKERG